MSLTDALRYLSGVKPKIARQMIQDWLHQSIGAVHYSDETKEFEFFEATDISLGVEGTVLTKSQIAELYNDTFDDWGKLSISPEGASILIHLYGLDLLPMQKKASKSVDDRLKDYASLGLRFSDFQRMQSEKMAERRKFLARPLDEIKPGEFSFDLLNHVFWREGRRGNSVMTIGCIEVRKEVYPYKSNTGKSIDFTVEFSWRDVDGKEQTAVKRSIYQENRRNDAGRNWGLYE